MNARSLIEALSLWEASGSQIAKTANETSEILARNGIPNLLAGGIAVQLHGYARFTNDVAIVVPDVQAAHELLISKGFRASLRRLVAVVHPIHGVTVDLLPAGKTLTPRAKVQFPQPTDATAVMQPVTLEELISLKLDSYLCAPVRREQDKVDVQKIIVSNRLPRNLPVDPAMAQQYQSIWDAIAEESAANPDLPEA